MARVPSVPGGYRLLIGVKDSYVISGASSVSTSIFDRNVPVNADHVRTLWNKKYEKNKKINKNKMIIKFLFRHLILPLLSLSQSATSGHELAF
jgi:hypothetical protein